MARTKTAGTQLRRKRRWTETFALSVILILVSWNVRAQQTPSGMTIQQAVQNALQNYPAITVSQEQIEAATAGIQLARTAYLPRIDSIAQINRSTRNNVFGLTLPQNVIPSISGPVLGTNNFGTVWNSAVGALVTWEPFDFGLRKSSVSAATAARARAESTLKRTQFEVAVETADAYLTLVAAQETVRAAQAAVDRVDVLTRTVQAQVDAQLRPGADASRAQAEAASARTQLAQAQQAAQVARAVLAKFVGALPEQVTVTSTRLLQLPPDQGAPRLDVAQNPVAAEQDAVLEQARAELQTIEKSYYPRFFAQGSAYGRGSGAQLDGTRLVGVNGLAPDTQNYALGFSVTFPILDYRSVHAKEDIQAARIRSETARYQQITTDLTAQWNTAQATLQGAKSIAANTPAQVSAANAATQQATARYQAGLGTVVELADAQRLLTQAEIDDALARLGVWRAMLGLSAAGGNVQLFLTQVGQ